MTEPAPEAAATAEIEPKKLSVEEKAKVQKIVSLYLSSHSQPTPRSYKPRKTIDDQHRPHFTPETQNSSLKSLLLALSSKTQPRTSNIQQQRQFAPTSSYCTSTMRCVILDRDWLVWLLMGGMLGLGRFMRSLGWGEMIDSLAGRGLYCGFSFHI